MLEHPEIGWIERTGYPSWLQETERNVSPEREEEDRWYERNPNGRSITKSDRH